MRYYHYGKAKELEANDRLREQKDRRYAGKLVIEEDTIYEIDEDCMHCLEQKEKQVLSKAVDQIKSNSKQRTRMSYYQKVRHPFCLKWKISCK